MRTASPLLLAALVLTACDLVDPIGQRRVPEDALPAGVDEDGDGLPDDVAVPNDDEDDDSVPDPDDLPPTACPQAARLDELLEKLSEELAAKRIPGGAVAIACSDGTVVAGGVGVRTRGGTDAVTGDTRFQLASITKSYTAATAILLDDDGALDLTAPLTTLLPDVNVQAPYATAATLEQLLAHSAGYPTDIPDADWSTDDLEGFFLANADTQLWSPPGRVYNYANYGYGLAGLAMQRAAGAPFAEVVEDRLFAPLGMTRSTMHAGEALAEGDVASGHSGSSSSPEVFGPMDSYYAAGWYGPMGGAWSSAADLARFAAVFLDDAASAPNARVRAEMSTPRIRSDWSADTTYGQGLFLDASGTQPVWSHGGSVAGFLSEMTIVPASGVAIVLLVNADWAFPSETSQWALDELGGWSWGERVDAPDLTDDIVGTYQDDVVLGTITVARVGTVFVATFAGADHPLQPIGADTALFHDETYDMDVPMVFWRNDDGVVDLVSTMLGVGARAP